MQLTGRFYFTFIRAFRMLVCQVEGVHETWQNQGRGLIVQHLVHKEQDSHLQFLFRFVLHHCLSDALFQVFV